VKYNSERADLSLQNLKSTGATWVAIEISKFQANLNSTKIQSTTLSPTDEELVHAIRHAKSLGLSVLLRPTIDLIADPDHWRGDIGKFFSEENWNDWFHSYLDMLHIYIDIAQREHVEMFSIGTDLVHTSNREANWRSLINSVRMVYLGNITYSSNWGGEETDKLWWDAVDVIGIDAHYPLVPDNTSPSVDDLMRAWTKIINTGAYNMNGGLNSLANKWNKSIIFTEIGACSGQCPYGENVDLVAQQHRYTAMFESFKEQHWFGGVFWWNWLTDAGFGGSENYCYSPQFKPTENILRDYFGGLEGSFEPGYPPVCPCQPSHSV